MSGELVDVIVDGGKEVFKHNSDVETRQANIVRQRLIQDNIYKPEASIRPSTMVVEVKLSRQIHKEKTRLNDKNYDLSLEVLEELKHEHERKLSEGQDDKTLSLAINEIQDYKSNAYRWFRDDGEIGYGYINKNFESIVDNLNTFGTEISLDVDVPESYSFLSSDSPSFWQSIGWPEKSTEESFLLIFPANGLLRERPWSNDGPVFSLNAIKTAFDKNTPALNERQKLLIRILWTD